MQPFSDRVEAGRLLASKLEAYEGKSEVVVVGLPRGGIPVAFEIAQSLRAPLDVMIVRKVGVPWHPELAMGAVASGGVRILDRALIRSLKLSDDTLHNLVAKEEKEIARREALLRDGHPALDLAEQTVLLVDDGAATGATMMSAIEAVRMQYPKEIVVAIPVASREAYNSFKTKASSCICLVVPEPFFAVGEWYKSFPQSSEEEVNALLSRSRLHGTEARAG